MLIERDYSETNKNVFQHLEGIHSKDYYYPLEIGFIESLLYQSSTANNHLGDFVNSYLFIRSKGQTSEDNPIDFAHLPDFQRDSEYLTGVRKLTHEDIVRRDEIVKDSSRNKNNELNQDFQSEPYIEGLQLSVMWQRQLLSNQHGLEIEQNLLDYYDYLKKLESGVYEGFNIDALPNNIIVDEQGKYYLFDREWVIDQQIDAQFIFYRALVIFALKNAAALKVIIRLKNITTLGNFLVYCFNTVGLISAIEHIEIYRKKDCEFQKLISKNSKGYSLTDLLEPDIEETQLFPNFLWRYDKENYIPSQQLFGRANTKSEFQTLYFNLPETSQKIACFRFYPFDYRAKLDVGFFWVQAIIITSTDNTDTSKEIWSLHASDEIAKANIAHGLFYSESDGQHLFMFKTADTFLKFELPDYNISKSSKLTAVIEYRIVRSQDYQLARYQYGSVQRVMDDKLKLNKHDNQVLENKIQQLSNELTEIKYSKVWRILQAYLDFFKTSGYPKKISSNALTLLNA